MHENIEGALQLRPLSASTNYGFIHKSIIITMEIK